MRDSNMAGCSPRPDRADAPSRPGPLRSALSGEQIRGDLLTATTWSWFAAAESHNRMSQNQANMVEVPGLSYGLFHAVAQLVCSWGIVRQVKFPGVNLDIGHIRNLGWAKDNDRQKWIGYNRLRGQYMSALEHAIPERFFNDPAQCNTEGSTTQTPGLPACPKGVSAVQALGTAAQAGQKIYTITQAVVNNNPGIVSSALSAHSADTRSAVQNALNAGLEVTIHERPVTISGWTGTGYTMIDPGTGAGGYIIEGGSNGGWLAGLVQGLAFAIVTTIISVLAILGSGAIWVLFVIWALIALANLFASLYAFNNLNGDEAKNCYLGGLAIGVSASGLNAYVNGWLAAIVTAVGLWIGLSTNATTKPSSCGI